VATSTCNKFSLVGNTVVCGNASQIYIGRRNNGCSAKIDWASLPGDAANVVSNNDSSVEVTFVKSGVYKVKASLNSDCGMADSLLVRVNVSGLNLGNDTILCSGNVVLHAGNQYKTYKWQDGSTDSVITVVRPGTYSVTVTDYCNTVVTDQIIIGAGPVYNFPKKPPVLLCQGNSIQLDAPDGFNSYTWYPDYSISNVRLQKPTAVPATDTNYIVTMIDKDGCAAFDTTRVVVQSRPFLQLPPDTVLCDRATLILRATQQSAAARYLWQDGSTNDTFVVKKSGTYIVSVQINGCSAGDTSNVSYLQTPTINLGRDTVKCVEDVVQLSVSFPGGQYLWQDNSQQATYKVSIGGIYYCAISNYCGTVSDTIVIKDQVCECDPVIPNAFSPNADGLNDEFKPFIKCNPSVFLMQIFDRNGQVIFETNDINKFWNGTYRNMPAPVGTYYYLMKIRGVSEQIEKIRSGSVSLLR
jgi:gliding motility-associated-like protein